MSALCQKLRCNGRCPIRAPHRRGRAKIGAPTSPAPLLSLGLSRVRICLELAPADHQVSRPVICDQRSLPRVVQSCTGKDPTHVRFGSKARKQTSELGRAFWLVILSALFDRASAGARLRKFSGRSCLPPHQKTIACSLAREASQNIHRFFKTLFGCATLLPIPEPENEG